MFRIKEARERVGLTQKELADELGIKPSTFNGYEKGIHDPKSDILMAIADRCGVTVDFLLGVKEKAPAEQGLSPDQIELLRLFDASDADGRDLLLHLARYTAKANTLSHPVTDEDRLNAALYRHMLLDSQKEAPADQVKKRI